MASLRKLFETFSDEQSPVAGALISRETSWRSFVRAVEAHGLASRAFVRLLARLWASAAANDRPIEYADIVAATAAYASGGDVERVVHDLRQDASALRRFAIYVRRR
jgi:hypothetical protein